MHTRALEGWSLGMYQAIATALLLAQLYFLYLAPISPYLHGLFFLTGVLILTFLRNAGWGAAAEGGRIHPVDIGLCVISIVPVVYILQDYAGFVRRGSVPIQSDILIGILFIALLIEAGRRVVGWILR